MQKRKERKNNASMGKFAAGDTPTLHGQKNVTETCFQQHRLVVLLKSECTPNKIRKTLGLGLHNAFAQGITA